MTKSERFSPKRKTPRNAYANRGVCFLKVQSESKLASESNAKVAHGAGLEAANTETIGIKKTDNDTVATRRRQSAPVIPVLGNPLAIIDHVNSQDGLGKDCLMAPLVARAELGDFGFLGLPVHAGELTAEVDEIVAGFGLFGSPGVLGFLQPPVIVVKAGLLGLVGSALFSLLAQR